MIINVQTASAELIPQKNQISPSIASKLKHGQMVDAKVTASGPGNRAQLSIAGQPLSAKTDIPLTPGTTLSLQVIRGENGLISLRLTPDALLTQTGGSTGGVTALGRIFQGLDEVLPQLGKTEHQGLRDILQGLALRSGNRNDGFLPGLLENMGLSFEKKMADVLNGPRGADFQTFWDQMGKQDLKAAVLTILQHGGEDGDAALMKGVSTTLDSFQQLNQQSTESNRYLLPFPILAGEQFNFGQLLVNTGKEGKKDDGDRVIQIAFLMTMSSLGSIRADFSILNKAITGGFLLENQETCDYLQSRIPDLQNRLEAIQYKALKIECRVGVPKELSSDALVQTVVAPMENAGFKVVI